MVWSPIHTRSHAGAQRYRFSIHWLCADPSCACDFSGGATRYRLRIASSGARDFVHRFTTGGQIQSEKRDRHNRLSPWRSSRRVVVSRDARRRSELECYQFHCCANHRRVVRVERLAGTKTSCAGASALDGNRRAPKLSVVIYLDYNATTPLCHPARAAMLPYLERDFGNPSSVHAAGREARAAIDNARDKLAALLRVKSSELIFTSGGTESCNLGVLGLARCRSSRGGHVIANKAEHHAVLNALEHLEKHEDF